jgi:hypothetical protein
VPYAYCIIVDEGEAVIDAGWEAIIEADSLVIIDGLDEPIMGLSLAIMVGEWLIIGDEEVLEVEEAGEEELQPARVSASTRPPPTGASRARERLVRMGASFLIIYCGSAPGSGGSFRKSGRGRARIGP